MKKLICAALAVLLCFTLAGCSGIETSKTYTFAVTTGDKISVTLRTGDGYELDQDNGQLSVSKDDVTILNGMFLHSEAYSMYEENIAATAERYEVIDNGLFYQYAGEVGTENDFLIMIPDSNTLVILGSLSDEAAAKAAFERLSFKTAD